MYYMFTPRPPKGEPLFAVVLQAGNTGTKMLDLFAALVYFILGLADPKDLTRNDLP